MAKNGVCPPSDCALHLLHEVVDKGPPADDLGVTVVDQDSLAGGLSLTKAVGPCAKADHFPAGSPIFLDNPRQHCPLLAILGKPCHTPRTNFEFVAIVRNMLFKCQSVGMGRKSEPTRGNFGSNLIRSFKLSPQIESRLNMFGSLSQNQ